MLKLYFYLWKFFLKIHTFEKIDEDKSFGEQEKSINYIYCFLLSCAIVKIF